MKEKDNVPINCAGKHPGNLDFILVYCPLDASGKAVHGLGVIVRRLTRRFVYKAYFFVILLLCIKGASADCASFVCLYMRHPFCGKLFLWLPTTR